MTNPILEKLYNEIPEVEGVKFLGSFMRTAISEESSKKELMAMIFHLMKENKRTQENHDSERDFWCDINKSLSNKRS